MTMSQIHETETETEKEKVSPHDFLKQYTGTDQPGRWLAVLVFAPLIFYKGLRYKDKFLIAFALILFLWDAYWLMTQPPRASNSTITTPSPNHVASMRSYTNM